MIDVDRFAAPVRTLIAAGRSSLFAQPGDPIPLSEPDRAALAEWSMRHGMIAWLDAAAAIGSTDGAGIAPEEAAILRRHAARSLLGIRTLNDLVERVRAAGVEVVAFKGPVLSATVYGDPLVRQFADLDLLVRRRDRDITLSALESLGYTRLMPRSPGDVVYGSIGAWPLVRQGSHGVDVHWDVAGRRFAPVLTSDQVLSNAVDVPFSTVAVRGPSVTHTAALTLAHAAKHLWYALELPLSIAYLARRTDVDWSEVRRLVLDADLVPAAAAGLQIASDLFGSPVPKPFQRDADHRDVDQLCSAAGVTLALPPGVFPDRRIDRRVHRLCFSRVVNRVRYDVLRVLEPTHADWEWLPLPAPLSAMYMPVRLVRLAVVGLTTGTRALVIVHRDRGDDGAQEGVRGHS